MAAISNLERPDRAVAAIDPALLSELIRLATSFRSKTPDQVAPPQVLDTRREFLQESLGETVSAAAAYERILGGDELQPINYLERGAIAARAVARIDLGGAGYGTGFLIAPQVLITNNHVLPDSDSARRATAEFQYEVDVADRELEAIGFTLRPDTLFHTNRKLDYTVVAVEQQSRRGAVRLSDFGCLPLIETTGKASEGEWLTVIQHPGGKRKQICVRENQFIKRGEDVLWYTTDTLPGASGSPVFNNDWYVVALHHSGIEAPDGARNSDGSTKWIANEGIRASRIVATLKQQHPDHPLLRPMYDATPSSARIAGPALRTAVAASRPGTRSRESAMSTSRNVTIELSIQLDPSGNVESVTGAGINRESIAADQSAFEAKRRPQARFDAPFDEDYSTRDGYNPDFLGNNPSHRVSLPLLSPALEQEAAPLLKPKGTNKHVLHYHNFSVVVHAERKLPIYSAANVSFAHRFEMSRPADVWRRDPRILAKYQLENWYYKANNFDRGHMTRREDLEYGRDPKAALMSASDTCHWSNCVPQHSRFNQNKEIWQGIERYILEESIFDGRVNAQIITGPILDDGDPEYRKIKYPLQFWKVVAAVNAKNKLFATAYLASQEEVISQFGIEVTEVPFGAYKTYQTKIAEIERLTGLKFICGAEDEPLRACDPLEQRPSGRPSRRRAQESTGVPLPEHYHEIRDLEDIRLPG